MEAARVEKWVSCMEGMSRWTPVRWVLLGVLSKFWGTDRLCRFPIMQAGLEMRNDSYSMDAGIVQNERPTVSRSRKVGRPLRDGKTSFSVEPARVAEYITSIYIPRR